MRPIAFFVAALLSADATSLLLPATFLQRCMSTASRHDQHQHEIAEKSASKRDTGLSPYLKK